MKIILISCLLAASNGQLDTRLDKIETRLDRIEITLPKKPVGRGELDVLDARWDKKLGDEAKRSMKVWHAIELDVRELKVYQYFLISGGIVGFIALFISISKFYRYFEKRVMKRFNTNEATMKDMIRSAENDRAIRQTERLLVLSQNHETIGRKLKALGFDCVQERIVDSELRRDEFERVEEESFDLVVFDNLDATWINQYMEGSEKDVFVGYHTSQGQLNVADRHKINFANSPMVLNARLLEAIHYRRQLSHSQG